MIFYLLTLVTFLVFCFIPLKAACPSSNGTDSNIYQWTDESGTVNYSECGQARSYNPAGETPVPEGGQPPGSKSLEIWW